MKPFVTRRRMEFSDTDMGGVVHFSRFFVFMETAEHEFLCSLGIPILLDVGDLQVSWPRVEATCRYMSPARYRDELEIEVQVTRRSIKTMTYEFLFRREDVEIARGKMTAVCCVVDPGGQFEAVPIPEVITDKLSQ